MMPVKHHGVAGFGQIVTANADNDESQQTNKNEQEAAEITTSMENNNVVNAAAQAFSRIAPSVVSVLAVAADNTSHSLGSGVMIFRNTNKNNDSVSTQKEQDGNEAAAAPPLLVLTCAHNIATANPQRVYIVLADRRVYRAKILGRDTVLDVAVLQLLLDERTDDLLGSIFKAFAIWYGPGLETTDDHFLWTRPLPQPAVLGNSSLPVGTQVLAIGAHEKRGNEAHAGIVTSFQYTDRGLVEHIFTDAGIYKGHSGGPLVDIATQTVVGIHSHSILSTSSSSKKKGLPPEERNVVLSMNAIRKVLPRMIEGETIRHGTIGDIVLVGLSINLTQGSLNSGVEIVDLETYSRAWRAGLRKRDVIVEIGGQPVQTARDAHTLIDEAPLGKKLEIVVVRHQTSRKVVTVVPYDKSTTDKMLVVDWFRDKFGSFRQNIGGVV